MLVVDGFTLCQTTAIERFGATKAGLLGKCALTDAKGDMLFETMLDVRQKISAGMMGMLAAEFPTEPGSFKLKDNSQGKYCKYTTVVKLIFQRTETNEQQR